MTQYTEHKRKSRPRFPRLSGRLHIFPALIPLVEILPWLLGAAGTLAGVTQIAFWRRNRRRLLVIAALCFLAAGSIAAWTMLHRPGEEEGSRLLAKADWPKLTTIAAPPASAPPVENAPVFGPLWTAPTKSETLATPVVAGNLMLVGTFAATLDARALSDGALVWSLKKNEPIFTNTVVRNGRGYLGEGLHTALSAGLTAFSLPKGEVLWERQFRSHLESGVLLDGNRLWTPAGEESLWCLDARDGSMIWRRRLGHTDATPLLKDGTLYAAVWPDGKVNEVRFHALDPDTGVDRWAVTLKGRPMGSPQAGPGDIILVTTAIGQVGPKLPTDRGWAHAVSAKGERLWTVELPSLPLPESLSLPDAGLVIHALKTGELVALTAESGALAWSVSSGGAFNAPAALDASSATPLLAAITTAGAVLILDARSGRELRRFNVTQGGYAAPVFDGDKLYIATPRSIIAYGGVNTLRGGAGD